MKVGFIGLGKLGLPIAETMALQHEVFGYDLLAREARKVKVQKSIEEVARQSELIFVAVQTPHAPEYDGSRPLGQLPHRDFDYSPLKSCLQELAPFLTDHQTVVIISTVLPGTCRRELAPLLKKGRLLYNPYLIAMGTEVSDFLNPEMVIVGSPRAEAAEIQVLIDFYQTMMRPGTRYATGTWEEAESIKIFYNTFISAKLSLVNMIQDVAQGIGHMNVDVVTEALSQSQLRIISPAYMKAGLGDGGPCHPRDNIALRWLSQELKLGYDLFDGIMRSREGQAANLARFLLAFGSQVVILGKAFKPGVSYVDGSPSVLVGRLIEEFGGQVHYVDPKTGDLKPPLWTGPMVYLIGHWEPWVRDYGFQESSIVVDPWRVRPLLKGVRHLHYGDTRSQDKAPQVQPTRVQKESHP